MKRVSVTWMGLWKFTPGEIPTGASNAAMNSSVHPVLTWYSTTDMTFMITLCAKKRISLGWRFPTLKQFQRNRIRHVRCHWKDWGFFDGLRAIRLLLPRSDRHSTSVVILTQCVPQSLFLCLGTTRGSERYTLIRNGLKHLHFQTPHGWSLRMLTFFLLTCFEN